MPPSASEPYAYLALDLGASSGRAMLGRFDGRRMEMEEVHRFPTSLLEDGERLYWDLEAIWPALNEGLRRARAATPRLRSLSVDSWGVDYVPLDHEGRPVRKAHCYRDPRTQGMIEKAEARVPAADLYATTGIQFIAINTLYQVLADQALEPDLFAQTANRLMIADYFNYRFSGRAVGEVSLASTTQLYDPQHGTWATDLMRRFDIPPESWPEIVPSGTRLGPIQSKIQNPQSKIEVVAGCSHDTASAVAAAPAEANGAPWAYLSSGTWSLLGVELPEPVLTEAARLSGFTNEVGVDGSIRFLKNLTGLWVLQECERQWKAAGETFDYATLLAEAEATPRSDGFVDLNEAQFGLRGDMQRKLAVYCDEHRLTVPPTRGAVVRLILESLAETYRQTLGVLEDLLGRRIEVLHVVGGGSRNALLCQWTADACRCRVVAGPAEATALGNLLVQAQAMDDLPEGVSIRDVVRASCDLHVYEPRN